MLLLMVKNFGFLIYPNVRRDERGREKNTAIASPVYILQQSSEMVFLKKEITLSQTLPSAQILCLLKQFLS